MKERPIIFSGEMVRAILDGRKTMTRRAMKPQPNHHHWEYMQSYRLEHKLLGSKNLLWAKFWHTIKENPESDGKQWIKFPYGQIGDRLWVRETHYRYGHWVKNGKTKTGRQKYKFCADKDGFTSLIFDCPDEWIQKNKNLEGWFKRPSIYMPRWASRILLEITNVRVERLNQIVWGDCEKEGIDLSGLAWSDMPPVAKNKFRKLWDSINGKKYPWASNPWVWVIEFKRLNP